MSNWDHLDLWFLQPAAHTLDTHKDRESFWSAGHWADVLWALLIVGAAATWQADRLPGARAAAKGKVMNMIYSLNHLARNYPAYVLCKEHCKARHEDVQGGLPSLTGKELTHTLHTYTHTHTHTHTHTQINDCRMWCHMWHRPSALALKKKGAGGASAKRWAFKPWKEKIQSWKEGSRAKKND